MQVIAFLGAPVIVDQLILALGLGSSGHHITASVNQPVTNVDSGEVLNSNNKTTSSRPTRSCPICEVPEQVCLNVTTPPLLGEFQIHINVTIILSLASVVIGEMYLIRGLQYCSMLRISEHSLSFVHQYLSP